jgi:hypothetical protein
VATAEYYPDRGDGPTAGPDDPMPRADWTAFQTARDRFFAQVRPAAMTQPSTPLCPEAVPGEWTIDAEADWPGGK